MRMPPPPRESRDGGKLRSDEDAREADRLRSADEAREAAREPSREPACDPARDAAAEPGRLELEVARRSTEVARDDTTEEARELAVDRAAMGARGKSLAASGRGPTRLGTEADAERAEERPPRGVLAAWRRCSILSSASS